MEENKSSKNEKKIKADEEPIKEHLTENKIAELEDKLARSLAELENQRRD